LTSGTLNNSNGTSDPNTRELLEQKAKWINDIECICQRNLLLYEAQQQHHHQQQTTQNNGRILKFLI
jgi:hypothetical protein